MVNEYCSLGVKESFQTLSMQTDESGMLNKDALRFNLAFTHERIDWKEN